MSTQNEQELKFYYQITLRKNNYGKVTEEVLLESGDQTMSVSEDKQVAKVSSSIEATYNMSNYQSLKVRVGIELPVTLNGKAAESKERIDRAYTYVQGKLFEEIEKLGEEAKGLFDE